MQSRQGTILPWLCLWSIGITPLSQHYFVPFLPLFYDIYLLTHSSIYLFGCVDMPWCSRLTFYCCDKTLTKNSLEGEVLPGLRLQSIRGIKAAGRDMEDAAAWLVPRGLSVPHGLSPMACPPWLVPRGLLSLLSRVTQHHPACPGWNPPTVSSSPHQT